MFCTSYELVSFTKFYHLYVIYMTVSLTSILELSCLIEIVFEKCHLKLILETVKIYEHRIL